MLIQFIRGFCMALADSVPGVSGGTIAFLLGFYDRFISSIDDVIHGGRQARLAAILWLLKLGVGWVCGFLLAVIVLTSLFESHIYEVSSLFMGFILCSIPIVAQQERPCLASKWWASVFILVGAALVGGITVGNTLGGTGFNVDVTALTLPAALYVLFSAMVAISAMVLPGISGSTLLLIFGLYVPVMGAVRNVLKLDFSGLPALIIFAVGVVCGIVLVVRLVRYCLEHFRAQTIYLIIGMMLGSIYAIANGPLTLDVPLPPVTLETFSIPFFIAGAVVVAALQGLQWLMARGRAKGELENADAEEDAEAGCAVTIATTSENDGVARTGKAEHANLTDGSQALAASRKDDGSQANEGAQPTDTTKSTDPAEAKARRGAHARHD